MLIVTSLPKLFGVASICVAPFIFITESQQHNEALIAHEMVHYNEQIKVLTIPWWIAYVVSSKFRLNAEVRAHKVEIEKGGVTVAVAASRIARNYHLDITEQEAVKLLEKE